ncbi:glycosyltransferase [Algoriphagus aquimarinus]|uniref:Glycosyltransferase n=1 Tax=Algoriphagus aquimarinus TaxID=237018 RepID=A0A5C7AB52_9BACT|nr:glycosyltransferase [Algoriphagus aquimarinus]TXE02399.1 glycosyltransferase [Algoriphagus aquimarinus]
MKIFQVIQKPQARGAELFACLLAQKLLEMNHEVILISIFEGDYDLPFTGRQIHLQRPIKDRLWDLRAWKSFADLIKKERPDLIQANAADTLKFAVFSKVIKGWKVPIIFRNASLVSRYINSIWVNKFNAFLYSQIDAIASVSEGSEADFKSTFSAYHKLHQIIPIGIEVPQLSEEKEKTADPILIHIGGFTFEKNHQELILIFKEISIRYPKATLWLFGEGPLKTKVMQQVTDLGLNEQVLFKGNRVNAFQFVPGNSIFVLPSVIEGLPAVILEAFANNVPVIAYNVGGIGEVVKNKETGWLVEAGDSQAFINAVLDVLNTPSIDLNRLTSNAKKLVIENYQIDQIAKKFIAFYRKFV